MNLYIYAAIAIAGALLLGGTWEHGNRHGQGVVQAAWDAQTIARDLAALQDAAKHQHDSSGVLSHAQATKPDLVPAADVAGRLRDAIAAPAHCPRLPAAAGHGAATGPPGAGADADEVADAKVAAAVKARLLELGVEMDDCVNLAHDYDTMVPLWHANEVREAP